MTDTSTPAQDLAALDRVAVIASEAGQMSSGLAVLLEQLRDPIALELDHRRALGQAFAWEHFRSADLGAEELLSITADILAAIASVGAEIVWPSPDSAETPERPSESHTAPETGAPAVDANRRMFPTYAAEHFGFHLNPMDGDRRTVPGCGTWLFDDGFWHRAEESAREKILAAVAAVSRRTPTSDLSQRDFVELAIELLDVKVGPPYENLVIAASFLVDAALERMDADR